MNQQENILTIFPTIIYTNKINREFTKDELNCILGYYDKANATAHDILSTDMNVLDNEKLSDIKAFCQEMLDDFFIKIYNPINPNNVRLKLTQSWLNFIYGDRHHESHKHHNSFMSGVIYINAYKDKDSIIFTKPDTDFNWHIQPKEATKYNYSHSHHAVNTGDIIIFPANLYHSTPVNTNNYVRISLAFSSFLTGTIGYVEGPLTGINQLKLNL
jgi:uncharacterized protein (TIGR02466 family)